jgi:hypothetical protein
MSDDLNLKYPYPLETSNTEKKDGETFARIKEYLRFQEKKVEVKFVSRPERVDGRTIVKVFKKLQRNSSFSKNALYDQNLKDTFKNFRAAMEDWDLVFKFKYLFVALEKVTNINGERREEK